MSNYHTGYRKSNRITNAAYQQNDCEAQYHMSKAEPDDYEDYMNPSNPTDKAYFMSKCMADLQNRRGGRKSRRTKRTKTRKTRRTKTRRRR